MGGNKKATGLKRPLIYHSSIPAHIRTIAQNIAGVKGSGKNVSAGSSLDQSVGFIAESPTKSSRKSNGPKKNWKPSFESDGRKKLPARHSQSPIGTSPNASRRPTSLQTNASSGYESEYQSSEIGSSWDWTAAEIIWKWQNNNLKTKKVYTDWANHYLDKAKCKRHIQDLQVDVIDGVVLADIIEAVTNQKITDINRKPKTSMQMIENIKICLAFLANIGVNLEGITAKDVREGNLKAILGLFFSLSRHKQKQKQQHQLTAEKEKLQRLQQEQKQQTLQQEEMPQPRLPSPYKPGGVSATNIPMPSAVLARRGGLDKSRLPGGLSNGSLHQSSNVYKCTSASSSRSSSPSNNSQCISIPRPTTARNSLIERQNESIGLKQPALSGSRTSLRVPVAIPYKQSQVSGSKNSILEKFRLFKEKDSKIGNENPKRISSSSGFSSAKSEHSDSSASLCNDARQTESVEEKPESASLANNHSSSLDNNSKLRSIRTKLTKTNCEKKQGSPKLKRMIETESRNNMKQIVKVEKTRKSVESGKKVGNHMELNRSQDKLNSLDSEKEMEPKQNCTNKMEISQTSSETTAKTIGFTGIPKPMAAVKGTYKLINTSDTNQLKSRSPSIPKICTETEKQRRDEVNIAMVSPMRTAVDDSLEVEEPKRIIPEPEKKLKEVEEEEMMNVKPMSPLLNGYRLRNHSGLHFTHPGYLNKIQESKSVYCSQTKANPDLVNLESIDLAMNNEMLKNMNRVNLLQNSNSGYVSDNIYTKIKDERTIVNETPAPKANQSIEKSFENQTPYSSPKGKIAVELSSDKNYLDETKGLVGSSPNQWPSQGDFHQSSVTYRSGISRSSGRKSDIGQQTDGSAFRLVQNTQWKKYPPDETSKLEDQRARDRKSPISNGAGRKSKSNKGMVAKEDTGGKQAGGEGKGKVKGVPSSFGYIKRNTTNGTTVTTKSEAKTAQVSAVPRTKVKVSGGTQTTSDLTHFKSYSLTGTSANQLSQCVRERLLGSQSLPKPGSSEYAALFHQHRQPQRQHKPTDGSLSDTTYATYSELNSFYSNNSPYSSWMRNSSTYTASLPSRTSTGLINTESLESLSSLPSQLQHRASLAHARLLLNQREGSSSPSLRLNRSNSIRSTKSEKLYPSMLQRSEETDPYYGIPINSMPSKYSHASQPTSPTPSQISQGVPSRYNFPISPVSSSASGHGLNRGNLSVYNPVNGSKASANDDDIHGSSLSLVSTASSLYSTAEEKQAHEIRKLRRELMDSQEKVYTLTSQLSTNAHVVSAFEKSLSSMTQRLQNLMATTEKKDQELLELRKNIELLRKQGREIQNGSLNTSPGTPCPLAKHQNINDEMTVDGGATITRQLSTDSVSSLNSLSSTCSISSSANCSSNKTKKKKKSWLRSSFSKAFSRSRKNKNGSVSDVEDFRRLQTNGDITNNTDISAPSSPLLNNHVLSPSPQNLKVSHSSSALYEPKVQSDEISEGDLVEDLKKQLREKDLVLTDIRLEALSSAHQLESLKDTVIKMRNELLNLKQDNERLQRIVTSKSLTSSQSSVNHLGGNLDKRYSVNEQHLLVSQSSSNVQDGEGGRRVLVSIFSGPNGVFHKYLEDNFKSETVIAAIYINQKTQWETLDGLIRKIFKEYVLKLDTSSGLGLNGESIWSYQIGEIVRFKDSPTPDSLPYSLLGEEKDILRICLKGAMQNGSLDALAFETLIPKFIIQRYVSLLSEHRRIILCGPSGTGKSYLANKLSEFLVLRTGKESISGAIATFNVDHKNSKELRQYLTNVAEQCETNASDLPSVIILDNLHQASSLAEVFNGFLSSKYSKCPFIIGTMNQATCSTTNLQLHHNFRWILCANHMEPVKGFLSRYLRRRTLDSELREGTHDNDLTRIIEWIPKVWHHLNKFIEMHTSSDVTIGPRLFLLCPGTVEESRVWFTDLWNYAIVPYLMDAVREGLQLYGKRAAWEDPAQFVLDTYPWSDETGPGGQEALLRVRPEDVGFDVNGSSDGSKSSIKAVPNQSESEGDPLLNMLLRLQEVANYTRVHVNANDVPDTRHATEVIPEIIETSKTSGSCI